MKKTIFVIFLSLLIYSCNSDDENISAPTDITSLSVEPMIGGAMLRWDIPADSSLTYVEVHYQKNGKEIVEKISKYSDSLLVDGLINKEPIEFKVQTVKELPGAKATKELKTTEAVTPIRREPLVTYLPDELEKKIKLTPDMIDTYPKENTQGPKANLLDDDPNTFWQSDSPRGDVPLPHWVQIDFEKEKEIGAIKFRYKDANYLGRPSQFALEVSSDGENWERVWKSQNNLPTNDTDKEYTLDFGENYSYRHFRVLFLENKGGDRDKRFIALTTLSVHRMKTEIIDKEKEAEEEYYNF